MVTPGTQLESSALDATEAAFVLALGVGAFELVAAGVSIAVAVAAEIELAADRDGALAVGAELGALLGYPACCVEAFAQQIAADPHGLLRRERYGSDIADPSRAYGPRGTQVGHRRRISSAMASRRLRSTSRSTGSMAGGPLITPS